MPSLEKEALTTREGDAPPAVFARPRRRRLGSAEAAPAPRPSSLIPAWLLAVAVAGSALAIGAVHVTPLLVIAAVVLIAAALALRGEAAVLRQAHVLTPIATCGLLAAFTLLQAAPIPMSALRAIDPVSADVWQRCLLPLGEEGPRWASISLDPGASLVEALKWAVYGASFATAAAVASRRGATFVITAVFLSSLLVAAATIGHGLLGLTRVYNLYKPTFTPLPWHVGPLLNPNNLAGYLNLGALAGIGVMLAHDPPIPPWLSFTGVTVVLGVLVTTASRGAVAALPIGLIVMWLFVRKRRSPQGEPMKILGFEVPSPSRATWILIAVVALGVVFALLGGTRDAWSELYDKSLSKLEMIVWAKPMLRDHMWLGVGRGAFESVFPAYRSVAGASIYTHMENFVLSWALEWGLPVTVLALGAFAWSFRPSKLGVTKSALSAGAWCGLAVLLLQNVVDLGLEVPALCIAAAVTAGALAGDNRRRSHQHEGEVEPRAFVRPRVIAIAIPALCASLIALVIARGMRDVEADRRAILTHYEASSANVAGAAPKLREELRAAMLRHPAEPYFPLLGGVIAHRARDQSPIPWIQRTLERAPLYSRAHFLLAQVLAGKATRKQSLLELRLAIEADDALVQPAAALALRLTRDLDELGVVLVDGAAGVPMIDALIAALGKSDEALRARLDEAAIARIPSHVASHVRLADDLFAALASSAPRCADRARCEREIEAHARAISEGDPAVSTGARISSRLMIARGERDRAVALLRVECDKKSDRVHCYRALIEAASEQHGAHFEHAARAFLSAACTEPIPCADAAVWLASIRTARGEENEALSLYQRAEREDSTEERIRLLAEAASRAKRHSLAEQMYRKLLLRRGGDAELQKRIDAERTQGIMQRKP